MSSGKKRPVQLGDAISSYLEQSGLAQRVEEASVVPDWEALVGKGIANVTVVPDTLQMMERGLP